MPSPPPLSEMHLETLRRLLGERVSTSVADRIAYAHDASPVALKRAAAGELPHLPAVIVWPESAVEIAAIMRWAQETGVPLTPCGSGSGIVGGALGDPRGVTLDLTRLDRIVEIDDVSLLVRVQPGINGQRLEDQLNARGYTLGHFPQSLRASTLGGWIAHRAAGVASTRFGKIEDLVEALEVVLPTGEIVRTRAVPRSATGPDLDQLFIGSEGAFGIVTEATVTIRLCPAARQWQAYSVDSFPAALDAIRRVIQQDLRPAIVRLFDAEEAVPYLAGDDPGAVVLLWGCQGSAALVDFELAHIRAVCEPVARRDLGTGPGEQWWRHRFSTSGLLHTIQAPHGIADALEISATWRDLPAIYERMRASMLAAAGPDARVFGHVSHVYPSGGNLYMIFHARAADDAAVPALYDRILDAAFTACLANGGSLSHHHGVGATKARWLVDEHGEAGLTLLRRLQRLLDPAGIMNPGVGLAGGAA